MDGVKNIFHDLFFVKIRERCQIITNFFIPKTFRSLL